ncbi:nonsense-mediated mRNA decay protein 3 [Grosmannia clavigera kw1407]|uniref:60S ribosomal export protein NMD3 n=1 Tax=Grosmannia clavigera (strain kw1407 / UAMH 11150) TaxID=655863 RepID=F0XSY6_GROCL|nr:nonsense-mediated mRNA decay protein 3 [Grosmannia clavigera kw1407]EFW99269.1 nonsense-mediated mRNA decay protein 3 [Grosmannia clavigera kw1407]
MADPNEVTAVSAPGKVLLAGGYLVLDRAYTGLVFGLSARINVVAQAVKTSPGVQLSDIVVESPQFLEAQWTYGYHLADDDGGIQITQLRVGSAVPANPFVETTLSYALTYVSRLAHLSPTQSIKPSRLSILADNDYYSQPPSASSSDTASSAGRFARFPTRLSEAHKTGLGSSAALVTSLTAAILSHYLPATLFDLASQEGKRTLHNLAQAAHCAAQGKVGSGFDVAAAVHGSCTYRRFSPSVLANIPEPGSPGFGAAVERVVAGVDAAKDGPHWDTEIAKASVALPPGVALRMCDVDCGSQTVGMVKKVLAWRSSNPEGSKALWDTLHGYNNDLATALKEHKTEKLRPIIEAIRSLVRKMGSESGVPIEPDTQTALLDALNQVEGVYGGVVPGAGGYDAVSLLVKDDEATAARLEAFLEKWSKESGGRVRLLAVKGEMEGVRHEDKSIYTQRSEESDSKMSTMDLDAPVPMASSADDQAIATILCYNCGAPIDGTTSSGALCYDCIKMTVDISQNIPREANVQFCRDCDRWFLPPSQWVVAAPESREMLAMCLKRLRGLNKVRVVDASFIWTEPNSRRVRVKLTVQEEVSDGVLLNQSFEVMYTVSTHQCPECAKSYTHNVWRACVQVRQKVQHKRTFLFLEQLILKHGAHRDTLNIKEAKEGLDFFFAQRNQATKFVDFLKSVVPVHVKNSPELVSEDTHTGSKSMKFAFSVELVPICKDDLVALPLVLAKRIGNIAPVALCYRIGTAINLLDPATLQTAEVPASIYWREKVPFTPLTDAQQLVEFVVLDIEPVGVRKGRWQLAEATVARASDLGSNDNTYFTRTHLGGLLHPGDSAMGYLLNGTVFNNQQLDEIEQSHAYSSLVPDVVLVKKHYPNRRKNKRRNWKLRRMAREEGDLLPKKADQERLDAEYEMFLQDVEEDDELRAALALYKNPGQTAAADAARKQRHAAAQQMDVEAEAADDGAEGMDEDGDEDEGDEGDDGIPKVSMDELLDDLDDLAIHDEE